MNGFFLSLLDLDIEWCEGCLVKLRGSMLIIIGLDVWQRVCAHHPM